MDGPLPGLRRLIEADEGRLIAFDEAGFKKLYPSSVHDLVTFARGESDVGAAASEGEAWPLLAALLKADAGLTQAIPGYLEIVPTTASKVRRRPSSGLTSDTSPRGQPYFGPCAHGPVLRRLPDARPAPSLSRRRRQHARHCWSGGA